MIIWNYVEISEACRSGYSILEFGCICNYILDDNDKTTLSYQKL